MHSYERNRLTVAAIVTIIMERRILNDNIGTEVDIMQNQFLTNYTEVTFLDKLKPKKYAERVNHIFEVLSLSLFECYDMTEKLYKDVKKIATEINNFLDEGEFR